MKTFFVCLLTAIMCAVGARAEDAKRSEPAMEPNKDMSYTIKKAAATPELKGKWDGPAWSRADVAEIKNFHAKSSDHRPATQAKVLYDAKGLYVIFKVNDRYVCCTNTGFQASVCKDSCAEFFVRPKADRGYFNFEMNCGGHLLLYYITDPTRTPNGFVKSQEVDWKYAKAIQIYHSLPEKVYPELKEETDWCLEYFVPFALFEQYVGPLGDVAGQEWRGNFYKCADRSSHPHWAQWAPIGEELNFHQPKYFGTLRFDR